MSKVAVGLSGGVDSSVAALLLKEQGHEVVGITMRLWREGRYKGGERDACFGSGEAEDIETAARLADAIGIDYRVYDCSEEYDKAIITYFRETYLAGKTPNPCVRCNAMMKFGLLPDLARRSGLDFDFFATGHYARTRVLANGRVALLRARDEAKDQSYFLCRLSQAQLKRHIFPLGDLTKAEVREIARRHGLVSADRPDSQDFYSGDVNELIGAEPRRGDFVDLKGRVVGHHDGFWRFTVGQRKGLGIGGGGEKYYVVDINPCSNRVVVGSAEDVVKTSFGVSDMNWVSIAEEEEAGPLPVYVKVRSASRPQGPATLDGGRCVFDAGIAGVAPGQSAVFYGLDRQTLLCAGTIEKEP
ncbi:MAG: tRNA 2-thiouridine(34) synthase MnmA [Kiritimatiellae bacterium]|nr:tRNA 2-thiouridine(34) synthase MnmA [Kiritimatiellia bacterium]